ncbi:MAG: DNA-directed RNA polymerase subunit omega [Acidobacteria bacterium]|nr:DNA-directed RNA polymerase subunit omega [Acidobacteriota bacterium]
MPDSTDNIDSKYRFILLAAKRARQLQGGAKSLIHTTVRKHTKIAQEELSAGVLQFEFPPLPDSEEDLKKKASSKKSKK